MDEKLHLQKRIMGIDFGTTRIGISLSDPLQIIAQPFQTVQNDKTSLQTLEEMIQRENVGLVVVGMPLNLKGEKGKKAEEVEKFVADLKRTTTVEIIQWDERFTTSLAHDTLLRMGTKRDDRRKKKARVDAMAAAILLQGYLDSRKRSLSC
jgi:putative Holliday junction resolvase